jgi:hypothetical protein
MRNQCCSDSSQEWHHEVTLPICTWPFSFVSICQGPDIMGCSLCKRSRDLGKMAEFCRREWLHGYANFHRSHLHVGRQANAVIHYTACPVSLLEKQAKWMSIDIHVLYIYIYTYVYLMYIYTDKYIKKQFLYIYIYNFVIGSVIHKLLSHILECTLWVSQCVVVCSGGYIYDMNIHNIRCEILSD